MRYYGAAGIAAPQIGYFKRIFVIEVERSSSSPNAAQIPLTVLINPEMTLIGDEIEETWEGCLSVPGYRGLVPRYKHLKYHAYDRNGQFFEREVTGAHAFAVQHETDHLDGIMFPMRIRDMKNFGCDDVMWEQTKNQNYPDQIKQKVKELMGF